MRETKVIVSDLELRAESVTDPLVIGDVNRLIFCFRATCQQADGLWHDCGWAMFYTNHCLLYKSGYPNDEAAPVHPLQKHGFDGATISKVKYSPWIQELEQQNRKKWPGTDFDNRYEHWLFPFKETTLEVIAEKLVWCLLPVDTPYKQVQMEMINWINNES